MGLYLLLQDIVFYLFYFLKPFIDQKKQKPVTFEPFEPQKRKSTKNDSTLHQKPIYSIR